MPDRSHVVEVYDRKANPLDLNESIRLAVSHPELGRQCSVGNSFIIFAMDEIIFPNVTEGEADLLVTLLQGAGIEAVSEDMGIDLDLETGETVSDDTELMQVVVTDRSDFPAAREIATRFNEAFACRRRIPPSI